MTTRQIFTSISATGTAETTFKSVDYRINITGRGADNAEARAKVDTIYAQVKKAIAQLNRQDAGVDEETMVCGYNVQPWNEYDNATREHVHKGYQVTGTVQCTSENVDAATLCMDTLTKITGATVLSPDFTADDSPEAREAATQAAYDRAMQDFRLQCVVLGRNPDAYEVLSYTTGAPMRHHNEGLEIRAMAASAPAAPPMEIKSGKAEITASVTLTMAKKISGGRSKPTGAATGATKTGNGSTTGRSASV